MTKEQARPVRNKTPKVSAAMPSAQRISNGARLRKFAYKHLGKPYKYGAKPREAPKYFDCSSFAQYLYRRVGIDLPRCSIDQAVCGKTIWRNNRPPRDIPKKNLQTGDLIFTKGRWGRYNPKFPEGIGHVAIYAGKGKVIQAKSRQVKGEERGRVIEVQLEQFLKRKDLQVIKRML